MSDLNDETTSEIFTVGQITSGARVCYCGAHAVLEVRLEPDGDPGFTCYEHAREWLDFADATITRLFGPKEVEAGV